MIDITTPPADLVADVESPFEGAHANVHPVAHWIQCLDKHRPVRPATVASLLRQFNRQDYIPFVDVRDGPNELEVSIGDDYGKIRGVARGSGNLLGSKTGLIGATYQFVLGYAPGDLEPGVDHTFSMRLRGRGGIWHFPLAENALLPYVAATSAYVNRSVRVYQADETSQSSLAEVPHATIFASDQNAPPGMPPGGDFPRGEVVDLDHEVELHFVPGTGQHVFLEIEAQVSAIAYGSQSHIRLGSASDLVNGSFIIEVNQAQVQRTISEGDPCAGELGS